MKFECQALGSQSAVPGVYVGTQILLVRPSLADEWTSSLRRHAQREHSSHPGLVTTLSGLVSGPSKALQVFEMIQEPWEPCAS
jgi:hypothetical protein